MAVWRETLIFAGILDMLGTGEFFDLELDLGLKLGLGSVRIGKVEAQAEPSCCK